jgi:hypothetical protein
MTGTASRLLSAGDASDGSEDAASGPGAVPGARLRQAGGLGGVIRLAAGQQVRAWHIAVRVLRPGVARRLAGPGDVAGTAARAGRDAGPGALRDFKDQLRELILHPERLPDLFFNRIQHGCGSDEAFMGQLWRYPYGDEPAAGPGSAETSRGRGSRSLSSGESVTATGLAD